MTVKMSVRAVVFSVFLAVFSGILGFSQSCSTNPPTFSPIAGNYSTSQTVTLGDSAFGAAISFSYDNVSFFSYTGPLTITTSQTLYAYAQRSGCLRSGTVSATYNIGLPAAVAPTFSPAAGTYGTAQTVTLTSSTTGAVIMYSLIPPYYGTYTAPISVATSQTIYAYTTAPGYSNSGVVSAAYTITSPPAATPIANPFAGTYATTQTVTETSSTPGATLYCTLDGTTPTTSSPVYTGPFTISTTTNVQCIATASGYSTSAVGSATYTIQSIVAAPTFSPSPGAFTSPQTVTVSEATGGATIHCTANGTVPSSTSPVYSSPFAIATTTSIACIGVLAGSTNSPVSAGLFQIGASTTPTPVPITGNLGTIAGNPQPYASVLIQLQNCANPITISGYVGIVATSNRYMADPSGVINGTIWANDNITCNGTTGASMYSEVALVGGIPSGQPVCYQVISTQGVFNLNTQQQIPCTFTPPNPQDSTFNNVVVTGFFQAGNGLFAGTLTVDGLLQVQGGISLGTASQNCPAGQFQDGLTTALAPICTSLPSSGGVTSFNGRAAAVVSVTGDYSYSQISGTPVFGSSPAAPTGLTNVVFQNSGSTYSAYLPATAVTPGAYPQANVTVGPDGRITAISSGTTAGINVYVVATGCEPAASTDSSCTGTFTIPAGAVPDSSYFPFPSINTITGWFGSISISGALTTTSVPYTITCTYNCSAPTTPTIFLYVHHN